MNGKHTELKERYRQWRNNLPYSDEMPSIYDQVIIPRGHEYEIGIVSVEVIGGIERVIIQSKINQI